MGVLVAIVVGSSLQDITESMRVPAAIDTLQSLLVWIGRDCVPVPSVFSFFFSDLPKAIEPLAPRISVDRAAPSRCGVISLPAAH
jgi:hypothetical protein